jgi:hypothetical protein
VKASTFVYPWDVNGDPEAAGRIAALGVRQATLAAAYHSTRALTPRHPRHRIVTAEHAAVLYPTDDRWQGRELRPYAAGDWAPGDAFGEAAGALAAFCLDRGVSPRAVRNTPALLGEFQSQLVAQGIELGWPAIEGY